MLQKWQLLVLFHHCCHGVLTVLWRKITFRVHSDHSQVILTWCRWYVRLRSSLPYVSIAPFSPLPPARHPIFLHAFFFFLANSYWPSNNSHQIKYSAPNPTDSKFSIESQNLGSWDGKKKKKTQKKPSSHNLNWTGGKAAWMLICRFKNGKKEMKRTERKKKKRKKRLNQEDIIILAYLLLIQCSVFITHTTQATQQRWCADEKGVQKERTQHISTNMVTIPLTNNTLDWTLTQPQTTLRTGSLVRPLPLSLIKMQHWTPAQPHKTRKTRSLVWLLSFSHKHAALDTSTASDNT